MGKKYKNFYRFAIGILGFFFIVFSFIIEREFFFKPEILLYLILSCFCAHFSISYGNVIVSFEILINYFIYLSFGFHYSALFSFLTILFTWNIQYFNTIKKWDNTSKRVLITAFFNSGMYASFYSITGILLRNLENDIIYRIFSIVLFIFINELIIIVDFLFDGLKETKEYLNKWLIITLIIESSTYSLAIPFSIIYRNNGFVITFPLFVALSIFSFIGNRMNRYQENLLNNISKIKELNESLRKISSIIEMENLIKTISEEAFRLFNAHETYIKLKFNENDGFYLKKNDDRILKKILNGELLNYKFSYKSEFVDIYINKDKIEKDEEIIFESFCKQCEVSLRNAYLHDISIHDGLTGLYTRRFFENRLSEELSVAKRKKSIFSIALLDLDNFKNINDTFGHVEGDKILIKFAQTLKKNLRRGDVVSRWGGDEFVILFPGLDLLKIEKIMQRIKNNLSKTKVLLNGKQINLNFSYSIFTYNSDMDITGTEIFRIIDRKLLEVKRKRSKIG